MSSTSFVLFRLDFFFVMRLYNCLLVSCKHTQTRAKRHFLQQNADSKSNHYGNAWKVPIRMGDRVCCSLIMFVHLIRFWFVNAEIACRTVGLSACFLSTHICVLTCASFWLFSVVFFPLRSSTLSPNTPDLVCAQCFFGLMSNEFKSRECELTRIQND